MRVWEGEYGSKTTIWDPPIRKGEKKNQTALSVKIESHQAEDLAVSSNNELIA